MLDPIRAVPDHHVRNRLDMLHFGAVVKTARIALGALRVLQGNAHTRIHYEIKKIVRIFLLGPFDKSL